MKHESVDTENLGEKNFHQHLSAKGDRVTPKGYPLTCEGKHETLNVIHAILTIFKSPGYGGFDSVLLCRVSSANLEVSLCAPNIEIS